jgi:hypothetical protein
MYSPVALIIDDDPVMAGRVRKGFLSETSLGVLEAHDLTTAYIYIKDQELKIDVVVTDLGFVGANRDPDNNLNDGLDFIAEVSKYRPDSESYVLSVNSDNSVLHQDAEERKLSIAAWFPKLGGTAKPWREVELACLVKTLKRSANLREHAREQGIDLRDYASDESIADKVRNSLTLPRITYLPQLPEEYEIIRPIEVLCVSEGSAGVRASAPYIGLIAEATGEDVEEAMENLADLIVQEIHFFEEQETEPIGYAAHVRDMLQRFVRWNQ